MSNYNSFCKSKECPQYIEWSFGYGSQCFSCMKLGETMNIESYPDDCLFKNEIEVFKPV